MEEDPEISGSRPDLAEDTEEKPPISAGAAVAIILAALLVIAFTIYFGVAQAVTGLVVVVGIPLVLLWFVWSVFVRRIWRIRRIRGAQERRQLLEAAMRDRQRKP